jgi:K+-sensing histidine kinase KdpD
MRKIIGTFASLAIILILTGLFHVVVHINATTIALLYLLTVIGSSAFLGYWPGFVSALSSALLLNFFFLPPPGTFYIAAPENWVAFFVYFISSFIVSHLTADLHSKNVQLEKTRTQLNALEEITGSYLMAERVSESLLQEAISKLQKAFGVQYCSISFFLPDGKTAHAASGEGPEIWRATGPKNVVELAAEAGLQYRYDILHLSDQSIAVLLTTRELDDVAVRKMSIALLALLQISLPILKVRMP